MPRLCRGETAQERKKKRAARPAFAMAKQHRVARKRYAPTPFLRPLGDSERLFCRGKDTDGTKKQRKNGCFFKNAPLFFQKPLIFGKTML